MDVLEAGERKIGENLTAQATSPDHQYFACLSKKLFDLDIVVGRRVRELWNQRFLPVHQLGTTRPCVGQVCLGFGRRGSSDLASL